jgi:hypothetical protein
MLKGQGYSDSADATAALGNRLSFSLPVSRPIDHTGRIERGLVNEGSGDDGSVADSAGCVRIGLGKRSYRGGVAALGGR